LEDLHYYLDYKTLRFSIVSTVYARLGGAKIRPENYRDGVRDPDYLAGIFAGLCRINFQTHVKVRVKSERCCAQDNPRIRLQRTYTSYTTCTKLTVGDQQRFQISVISFT
jgi:hypothetical protein